MSGIGELQTVSAVFDLLKLAQKAGQFLQRVRDADEVAAKVLELVQRLTKVLDGVHAALVKRDESGIPTASPDSNTIERSIRESVQACTRHLQTLQDHVGGFDSDETLSPSLLQRFKIACRRSGILRRQTELEAQISMLQTELVVLHLYAYRS